MGFGGTPDTASQLIAPILDNTRFQSSSAPAIRHLPQNATPEVCVGIRGAGPARKGRRGHEWWRLGLQTHGEVHVIYAAYM